MQSILPGSFKRKRCLARPLGCFAAAACDKSNAKFRLVVLAEPTLVPCLTFNLQPPTWGLTREERPGPIDPREEKEAEKNRTTDSGIKPAAAVENVNNGSRSSSNAADEREGSLGVFSTCGTTSLIVLVSDLHVICCNTGDSR